MKKISFDVDSVLLDTELVIFDYVWEEYDTRINAKDVTHWSYYIENFPSVSAYFGNPEIYKKVKPVKGMVDVVTRIVKKYGAKSIQLITSSHENVREAKDEALERFYGHIEGWKQIDTIHVGLSHLEGDTSHHKHIYSENTLMVDDAIHNMKDHLDYNHYNKGILVDFGYGWNQNYEDKRSYRVNSPSMLEETIYRLVD